MTNEEDKVKEEKKVKEEEGEGGRWSDDALPQDSHKGTYAVIHKKIPRFHRPIRRCLFEIENWRC